MGSCNCSNVCKDNSSGSVILPSDDSLYSNNSKDQITITYANNNSDLPVFLSIAVRDAIREHSGKVKSPEMTKMIVLPDRSMFLGECKENTITGLGERYYPNGSYAKGDWTNGLLNGNALFIQPDGSYFLGEFKDWNMHGFGRSYNALAKYTYEGYWADNYQEGYGTENWESGTVCIGMFKNGLKNGKNIMSATHSHYNGDFRNDKISGFGAFQWDDGKSYEGWWENNQMHGLGTFTWPNGKKYVGRYVNDQKSGFGIFFWEGGKRYEGQWLDGLQHGLGKMVEEDGTEMYGEWIHGYRLRWISNP